MTMEDTKRCAAVVDLAAIRENLSALVRCHIRHTKLCAANAEAGALSDRIDEGSPLVLATVKANAYGHGAVPVAKVLDGLADYYAVACIREGLELREGGITKPVLVLGPVFEEEMEAAVRGDLILTVFDTERAAALDRIAASLHTTAHIHAAADTGMSRIGVRPDESGLQTLQEIARSRNLSLDGIFTHFATADEADKKECLKALGRFRDFRKRCHGAGLSIPVWHAANTASVIDGIGAGDDFDMIRCGIGLYGYYPSDEVIRGNVSLRPALRWTSRLSFVKEIAAGTSVSYGYHFTAERDMRVGTVCCGYADGYPRLLSSRGGEVLIRGKRCRILGNICMDQFMVDLDGTPEAAVGDEVVLLGSQGGQAVTADEIAEKCGTISYEVLCDISPRTVRVYRDL